MDAVGIFLLWVGIIVILYRTFKKVIQQQNIIQKQNEQLIKERNTQSAPQPTHPPQLKICNLSFSRPHDYMSDYVLNINIESENTKCNHTNFTLHLSLFHREIFLKEKYRVFFNYNYNNPTIKNCNIKLAIDARDIKGLPCPTKAIVELKGPNIYIRDDINIFRDMIIKRF